MKKKLLSNLVLIFFFLSACKNDNNTAVVASTFVKTIQPFYVDFFENSNHLIYLISNPIPESDTTAFTEYLELNESGNETGSITIPGAYAGNNPYISGISVKGIYGSRGQNLSSSFCALVYDCSDSLCGYNIDKLDDNGALLGSGKAVIPSVTYNISAFSFTDSDSIFYLSADADSVHYISFITDQGVRFRKPFYNSNGFGPHAPVFVGPGPGGKNIYVFSYDNDYQPIVLQFDYTGTLVKSTTLNLISENFTYVVQKTVAGFEIGYFNSDYKSIQITSVDEDMNALWTKTIPTSSSYFYGGNYFEDYFCALKVSKDGETMVAIASTNSPGRVDFFVLEKDGTEKFSFAFNTPSTGNDSPNVNVGKLSDGSYMIMCVGTLIKLNSSGKL
jgi:hypothetical protein